MRAAVLDIGGSYIKYGRIEKDLEIINRGKLPTPEKSMEELFHTLDEVWRRIGKEAEGLAVSMPGVIDSSKGYAFSGGSLHYLERRYFARELEERYGVPVWIGNDAKCAAVAEVGYGVLQDVDTAFVVILGTGIGGCLIQDHRVYFGKHFSAGEVSFLHTNYHDPHNEEETWARVNGVEGLLSMVQKHTGIEEHLSGEEIFSMAEAGNVAVLDALDEFSEAVAVQLFNLNCILDVEKIAIGGGISAQPMLLGKINGKFCELYLDDNYPIHRPPVVACRFRNDANMIGAYYQLCQWKRF